MIRYKVTYTLNAIKDLKKLDKGIQRLIYAWIDKNLQGCVNPRQHGKGLVGDKSGMWRYRIGDYRLLCEIHDKEITILVLEIGIEKKYIKNKI